MKRFFHQLFKDLGRPLSRVFPAQQEGAEKFGLLTFPYSLWNTPSIFGPLTVIIVCLEVVIFYANPPAAFLVKSFFAILALGALSLTLDILKGRRVAVWGALFLSAWIGLVSIVKASGPYQIDGARQWKVLPVGSVLRTQIYSQQGSQRWDLIDKNEFMPYVFIPLDPDADADGRLSVNGLVFPSIRNVSGLWEFAASMAVPIPWELVEAYEFLNIEIEVTQGGGFRLSTTPLVPRSWPTKPQTIKINGKSLPVADYLQKEERFVIEARIANKKSWVIGILY